MYETELFIDSNGKVDTFYEFREWLKNTQKKQKIEITSVTSLGSLLIVVYKSEKLF